MVFPILVSSLAPGDPINNLNVMGPLAGIGCPLACQIESRAPQPSVNAKSNRIQRIW